MDNDIVNSSEVTIFGMLPHITEYTFDTFWLKIDELTNSQKTIRYAHDYLSEIESVFSRNCDEYEESIKMLGGHAGYFRKYYSIDHSEVIKSFNKLGAKEYEKIFVEVLNKFKFVYNNTGNNDIEKTINILKYDFEKYDKMIRELDHKIDVYFNNYNNEEVENDKKLYLDKYLKEKEKYI